MTVPDHRYARDRDAEAVGDNNAPLFGRPDFSGVGEGEFPRTSGALFGAHVCQIVQLSAQEQVSWAHALRVVASVQYAHAGWDFPFADQPRDPMSGSGFSEVKLPVSGFFQASGPLPAVVSQKNLVPKA